MMEINGKPLSSLRVVDLRQNKQTKMRTMQRNFDFFIILLFSIFIRKKYAYFLTIEIGRKICIPPPPPSFVYPFLGGRGKEGWKVKSGSRFKTFIITYSPKYSELENI